MKKNWKNKKVFHKKETFQHFKKLFEATHLDGKINHLEKNEEDEK